MSVSSTLYYYFGFTRVHKHYRYRIVDNIRQVLQVSSATATFAMTFSASMSVIEYYLLKRFPVPYGKQASYFPL